MISPLAPPGRKDTGDSAAFQPSPPPLSHQYAQTRIIEVLDLLIRQLSAAGKTVVMREWHTSVAGVIQL